MGELGGLVWNKLMNPPTKILKKSCTDNIIHHDTDSFSIISTDNFSDTMKFARVCYAFMLES